MHIKACLRNGVGGVFLFFMAGLGYAHADDDQNPWALTGDPVPPDSGIDKSTYDLFTPAPDESMRPLSTDRPGKTHSSETVDPGHFQVESDFAVFTYDHDDRANTTSRSLMVGTPILKAGVTDSADIEATFNFYNDRHISNGATGVSTRQAGFGDISLGSKINLFGNEGGTQALALLPFIKFPTAGGHTGNGVIEYSLATPYTINLDTLWSLTVESQLGALKNASNTGHHGDYGFLANINRPVILPTITAALEIASDYSSDHHAGPQYTLDPSLQWKVLPDLQFDVGSYIGLNRAAPDYIFYTGVSYRY